MIVSHYRIITCKTNMKINLLTIFPSFFESPLKESILKRAEKFQRVQFDVVNIRDFAQDKHKTTDDRPYGGGPGMVMKVEPIYQAVQSLKEKDFDKRKHPDKRVKKSKTILTSAKGTLFTQQKAVEYAHLDELSIICGHYEGVDERVAHHLVDEEVRIGDYVLTGGETASLVIVDAVTRLIPGVLGNDQSTVDESHSQPGQLGYPQYTRPAVFKNWSVPQVLQSGNHQQIQKWRDKQKKR